MNKLFRNGFICLALIMLVLISFNGENAHAEEGYSEVLIPKMNSNESEFGKASYSSNYSTIPSWKAFDGVEHYNNGGANYAWGTSAKTRSLAYEFSKISTPSKPDSISIDRNVLELSEYRYAKLTATILPENTNENIIWTSSDESIATVDQFGTIRAIKEGVVTITAHLENTNLTADCIVTVKKLGSTESKSIVLDRNVLELSEYRYASLTATILPENTNENIIWTSSDESIATVDQFGTIRAIKEGVVTITAHLENTNLTADCIVTVKKLGSTESKSIILDRNFLELSEYRYDRLTATILPENTNENIIWTSSDKSIATVDQFGTIRAIKEGVVTITAHLENTNLSADCIVTVKKLGGTE